MSETSAKIKSILEQLPPVTLARLARRYADDAVASRSWPVVMWMAAERAHDRAREWRWNVQYRVMEWLCDARVEADWLVRRYASGVVAAVEAVEAQAQAVAAAAELAQDAANSEDLEAAAKDAAACRPAALAQYAVNQHIDIAAMATEHAVDQAAAAAEHAAKAGGDPAKYLRWAESELTGNEKDPV